jgi:von Willebrand factor type A domain
VAKELRTGGIPEQVGVHLQTVISLLVGVVITGLVALLPDVPRWSSVLAAALLVPPLVLASLWVADPRAVWRARRRKRMTILGGPLAAAAALLLIGAGFQEDRIRSLSNYELVLDGSASMAGQLRGRPKTEIAAEEVGAAVGQRNDTAVALRTFGGDCGSTPELVVELGTGHADRVQDAARELDPGGESNLVDAVVAAVDDFSNPELFPDGVDPEKLENRIIVITGSGDTCKGDLARLEEQVERSPSNVELEYAFIGLGIEEVSSQAELEELAATVGAEALFAQSADDLDRLLDEIVYDGYFDDVNELTNLVNEVGEFIFGDDAAAGAYLDAVDAQRANESPAAAVREVHKDIASARQTLEKTENHFQALEKPLGPGAYRELWEIDVGQRDIQHEQLARIEELVSMLERDGKTLDDGGEPLRLWQEFESERERYHRRNTDFDEKAGAFLDSVLV